MSETGFYVSTKDGRIGFMLERYAFHATDGSVLRVHLVGKDDRILVDYKTPAAAGKAAEDLSMGVSMAAQRKADHVLEMAKQRSERRRRDEE